MVTKSQRYYDPLYSWKDYPAEVGRLQGLVESHKHSAGRRLLDVACGTGKHLALLQHAYDVAGLDIDEGMLAIARKRLPDVPLHLADFRDFDLGQRFDVVVCLFSSIAYARDSSELSQAIDCMARHLEPGGVLAVEPFIDPEEFVPGPHRALSAEVDGLQVARMSWGEVRDRQVHLECHYLVGQPDGIEYFSEAHLISLFRSGDYLEAFARAGLEVEHDQRGLMGRGLFLGTRALSLTPDGGKGKLH